MNTFGVITESAWRILTLRDFGLFAIYFHPQRSGLRPPLYDYDEGFSLFVGRFVGTWPHCYYKVLNQRQRTALTKALLRSAEDRTGHESSILTGSGVWCEAQTAAWNEATIWIHQRVGGCDFTRLNAFPCWIWEVLFSTFHVNATLPSGSVYKKRKSFLLILLME